MIARRLRLILVALLLAGQGAVAQTTPPRPAPDYAVVKPGHPLAFPVDHGAHPLYRTEWWYLTGWLNGPDGPQGFQITIFRSRTGADPRNPSAFSARQILFAHAALSDPKVGRLLHDQRIARQGFGLAETALADTDIVLDDWSLKRERDGRFIAKAGGKAFWLDLALAPTQPPLPQGIDGYSRKGPLPEEASHYYSMPHLKVTGSVRRAGHKVQVTGEAWLDREWSSTLLDPKAVGWDWTGINLDDGSALMAFQVRDAAGRALWAGGSLRAPTGTVTVFEPADVAFGVLRRWRSPRTGANYPVARVLTVRTAQGLRRFSLAPLFDDQELDSRGAGGPVYWEGAVRTEGGRGYLELTGYVSPLRL